MGLVLHGPDRMGEEIELTRTGSGTVRARIVDQVFYDKAGEKQDG
jgi:sarcosine oxidase subunit alpha